MLSVLRQFRYAFIVGWTGLFLLLAIATLRDYGVTWDYQEFYAGDKYFYFYTTLDPAYLDMLADNIPLYRRPDHPQLHHYAGFFQLTPHHVWPLGPLITAVSKHVFYTRLNWLEPFAAHHLGLVLVGGALLLTVYLFALRHYGTWVAIVAAVLLASHPRLWADVHNNMKDVPACLLWCLVIAVFCAAIERERAWLLWLAAILWGAALATKANALFLPLVLGPYFLQRAYQRHRQGHAAVAARLWLPLIFFPVVGLAMMFLLWPYLWLDFPAHLLDFWRFLGARGASGTAGWKITPLLLAVSTMPLPMLALLVLGVGGLVGNCLRRQVGPVDGLLLLWLVVPVLRVSVPYAGDFDGIRHWLEFVPAASLVAGLPAARLLRSLAAAVETRPRLRQLAGGPHRRRALALLAVGALLLPTWAWSVRNHPNQIAYFNVLVGGLRGAQELGLPEATDYWGSAYRQGLRWLNAHAPPDAGLLTGVGQHIVFVCQKTWLRRDVRVVNYLTAPDTNELRPEVRQALLTAPGGAFLMYITRREHYPPLVRRLDGRVPPVFEVTVDGAPILRILRLEPAALAPPPEARP